jgi:hypothetical protein
MVRSVSNAILPRCQMCPTPYCPGARCVQFTLPPGCQVCLLPPPSCQECLSTSLTEVPVLPTPLSPNQVQVNSSSYHLGVRVSIYPYPPSRMPGVYNSSIQVSGVFTPQGQECPDPRLHPPHPQGRNVLSPFYSRGQMRPTEPPPPIPPAPTKVSVTSNLSLPLLTRLQLRPTSLSTLQPGGSCVQCHPHPAPQPGAG